MSHPQVVLSAKAERDLDLVYEWFAQDTSVARADAIVYRIKEALQLIATFPRIGRARSNLDGSTRTFSLWPWVVVYEPLPDGGGVVVWRVVDGRRDIPRL
jgi:plasmid stabilization system protein ParE